MKLATLLFLTSLTSAGAAPFAAWPLQLSCGTQEAEENGNYLAHGSLVFRDQAGHTRAAYFQSWVDTERYHPFCGQLGQALREKRWVLIETRPAGGLEVLIDLDWPADRLEAL